MSEVLIGKFRVSVRPACHVAKWFRSAGCSQPNFVLLPLPRLLRFSAQIFIRSTQGEMKCSKSTTSIYSSKRIFIRPRVFDVRNSNRIHSPNAVLSLCQSKYLHLHVRSTVNRWPRKFAIIISLALCEFRFHIGSFFVHGFTLKTPNIQLHLDNAIAFSMAIDSIPNLVGCMNEPFCEKKINISK